MAAPPLSAPPPPAVMSDEVGNDAGSTGIAAGAGLQELREQHGEDDAYTLDGSVDIHGRPSVRAKTGGWRACPFILGNEGCERLAYYGIGTNLVIYLHKVLHQPNATAATNVTNWSGTCYITPLIGGFIADAYIGRYWTIALFSTIYFVGMTLLTLSAALPELRPPSCPSANCPQAKGYQVGIFYLSLYIVALGTGGIKPCVSSFGADQFDEFHAAEKKRKTSFFNWFYFSVNIGALISSSILVYIQDNVSWAWGFGIPAAAMGIAIFSFFLGTYRYRHQKPTGSPLTRIVQVIVAALRKWDVKAPTDEKQLYEVHDKESISQGIQNLVHSPEFRFLDKAATPSDIDLVTSKSRTGSQDVSPWRLVTVTQVEEVKLLLRLFPIWATSIVFSTVYAQMSTLFVEQGSVMNTHISNFKIPAASLSIFDTLSVIVWVPIYDRLLVPFVRRFTGNIRGFTQLQRMGIGLAISIFAMVSAAVVEIERLKVAREKGLLDNAAAEVPISIFWQIPQYFLIGAAEVFMFIGQLEFFYDQAPHSMRSLLSALSLTTVALGNYLSSLLVTIVTSISERNGSVGWIPANLNRGHIDYFFWLLAVLSFLNLLAYLACAKLYKYKSTGTSQGATEKY